MDFKFLIRFNGRFILVVFGFLALMISFYWNDLEAASLSIPKVQGQKGELVSVPVEIREGKGIAGLKLEFVYRKDVLKYKDYRSLPLIQDKQVLVNSPEPGRLIFVMAGPTGIKDEQGPLITFNFEIIAHQDYSGSSALELVKVEMLDEKIKPVPFTVENGLFQLNKTH